MAAVTSMTRNEYRNSIIVVQVAREIGYLGYICIFFMWFIQVLILTLSFCIFVNLLIMFDSSRII